MFAGHIKMLGVPNLARGPDVAQASSSRTYRDNIELQILNETEYDTRKYYHKQLCNQKSENKFVCKDIIACFFFSD